MTIKLRACPFCGESAAIRDKDGVFWVECTDCLSEGSACETEFLAVAAWNTRYTEEPKEIKTGPSVGVQCMPKINGVSFRCDCGCNVFTKVENDIYICNSCELRYHGQ